MSNRHSGGYGMSIKGVPFLTMWYSGTDTGFSIGIKHLERNIHLTMCSRKNLLNFHITDTKKDPQKVWEVEMTPDELLRRTERVIKRLIRFYWWGSKYYQFSDNLHDIIESYSSDSISTRDIELDPFVIELSSDDFTQKKRIRDGYHQGMRAGIVYRKDELYIVVPITRYRLVEINVDFFKSPLNELPPIQGFSRYFDYLDEERIFETSPHFNEEYRDRCKVAILGLLSEAGYDTNDD
jgi:hypothetical protein